MANCLTDNCGFKAAEANRAVVRYQKEDPACAGKLLTSGGVTKVMRAVSADFEMEKKTSTSEEIRADRQVSNIYALNASSKGKVDFEFSAGTADDFIASFLGGTWTTPVSFAVVRGEAVAFATPSTLVITGSNQTGAFPVGSVVKTEGFLNASNNRYWSVTGSAFAAGNTTLTVTGTAVAEAGSAYTAVMNADDVLVTGTSIQCDSTGFHAGGASVFAAARAAGKLEVGRTLIIQGLGYAEGTLDFTAGQPAAAEVVTIANVNFEFTAAGAVEIGNIAVTIGADADATANNLRVAIMRALNERKFECSADYNATSNVLTVRSLDNTCDVAITGTLTNVVITNFSGRNATTSGRYTILSATDTAIAVSPTPEADTNAGAKTVVIKGSHLVPPANPDDILKDTYTFETDLTDVNAVMLYKGQMVGGISLEASAEDIIKGNIDFQGSQVEARGASVLAGAPTVIDALATPVYNATSDVRSVRKNYSGLGTAIMSFTIDMKTDLKQRSAIGHYFPVGYGQGNIDVTGKIEAYFYDTALFNDFYNNVYVAFDFLLRDADANVYVITLPKVFLKKNKPTALKVNTDIMEEIEYGAVRDPITKATVIFNRFSSALPVTA